MMLKKDKMAFVEEVSKDIKNYKLFAIIPLSATPDTLFQKVRNQLKPGARVIVTRNNLLRKIIEKDKQASLLMKYVEGNVALVMSKDEDPFALYRQISANRLKLFAKPNQIAPSDIMIEEGETSIPPGQAVTELKAAGIDVKIDKGKVVISKTKVLVPKGTKIASPVSKALKTLNVMPFEVSPRMCVAVSGGLVYTEDVLGITYEIVSSEIASAFRAADSMTMQIGYVTHYNVERLLAKAYTSALALGLSAKIYEPTISERLLAQAFLEAVSLKSRVPEEEDRQEGDAQVR